jgi:hypothetical protein
MHDIAAPEMAAYRPAHDEGRILAVVAFLQKLPDSNEIQY